VVITVVVSTSRPTEVRTLVRLGSGSGLTSSVQAREVRQAPSSKWRAKVHSSWLPSGSV
jgi:hypothetical protein